MTDDQNAPAADPLPRVLPPTITDGADAAKRARSAASRAITLAKHAVFNEIYDRVVVQVDPLMRSDPRTNRTACWKAVCSHKFRAADARERATAAQIEVATTEWLMLMRNQRPIDPPHRRNFAEGVPRLLPATRSDVLTMDWAHMTQNQLADALKAIPPYILDISLQDKSPILIERIFEIMGLSAPSKTCPVCMEPKVLWASFTKSCRHMFCIDCAVSWAKSNVLSDGTGCPTCIAERVPKERCAADPAIMFPKEMLKRTLSLIPFSAAQIPLLQRTLDAELGQEISNSRSARCPDCSTVSTHGNNFLRRCHNPLCVAEFCVRCDCALAPTESRTKHIDGTCVKIAEETAALVKEEGMSPCPKCGSQIWHAVGHACHAVKCPACTQTFCHACGVPYNVTATGHTARCSCPIYCGDNFKCKCAKSCPECVAKTCEHCNGACPTCLLRKTHAI